MLRTHAPDYARAMDERYPAIWTIYGAPDMEGEQMAMGAIAEGSMASVFHLFTRKDWLDALGVELPDYDATKVYLNRGIHYYENAALTLDWLENLLVAYRDGDPDGNGKNDTIPYGAYTLGGPYGSWPWGAIQGALGVPTTNLDRNHYVDGELYIVHVSPRFREFTELVARWWDMGLIDSEFFTIDRGASWEKAATGAFGVYNSNYNYVGRVPARPPDNLISDEDVANGVELVMFAPIGPRGEQFAGMYGTSYVRGQVQVMNKNLDDAKTARIMEIVNTKYRLNDGTNEGIDLWIQWEYNHGEEGVHWEWAGEPYKSQTRRIPPDRAARGRGWDEAAFPPTTRTTARWRASRSPIPRSRRIGSSTTCSATACRARRSPPSTSTSSTRPTSATSGGAAARRCRPWPPSSSPRRSRARSTSMRSGTTTSPAGWKPAATS